MGEIADDMVQGRACALCGQYFIDPKKPDTIFEHGYPVACHTCWNHLKKDEKAGLQRAIVDTF